MNVNTNKKVNYQTIALCFLTAGIDATRTLLNSEAVSDPYNMALKAAAQIGAMGGDAGELNKLVSELKPENMGEGRGRTRLSVGDQRLYKAQKLKDDGELFIRLPVSSLVANKGDKVIVKVENNVVTVVRA